MRSAATSGTDAIATVLSTRAEAAVAARSFDGYASAHRTCEIGPARVPDTHGVPLMSAVRRKWNTIGVFGAGMHPWCSTDGWIEAGVEHRGCLRRWDAPVVFH